MGFLDWISVDQGAKTGLWTIECGGANRNEVDYEATSLIICLSEMRIWLLMLWI